MKKILLFVFLGVFPLNSIRADITWDLSEDGTLTISGTDMPNYGYNTCGPWYSKKDNIKKVVIENGVTNIGNYAFKFCDHLTSVKIPSSVKSIGKEAFYSCSSLNKAEFSSIEALCKIKFESYEYNPLYYAHHLYVDGKEVTDLVIPNSITCIGDYTFYNCSNITSVSIGNGLTSIGRDAFYNCSSLKKVEYLSVETLCKIQFWGNTSNPLNYAHHLYVKGKEVTELVIPNSVTNIGKTAFYGCFYITSIQIPNSVKSIEGGAFANCYNLQSITLSGIIPPFCTNTSTFECSTSFVRDKYDVYNYATLHVPMGSKEAYSSAYEWRYFNKIKEDMEINGKVYYAKLAVKQGTTGYTEQPVKADETYTIFIGSIGNSKINAVTFNGEDVTDQVKDGYYTTPEIKAKSTLSISYEDTQTSNVKEISNPELKVMGSDGEINITGIDNPSYVEVYTSDGKLVEAQSSVYGNTSIQVKEDNLYLVKVGKRVIKIAM